MAVLLEEEQAERESLRKHGSPGDAMSFSDGSSRLNTKIPFLSGRPDVPAEAAFSADSRVKAFVIVGHRSQHPPASGAGEHPDERPRPRRGAQPHAA